MSVFARIGRLAGRDMQRIGLSATVGNPEEMLSWLSAGSQRPHKVVWPKAVETASTAGSTRLRRISGQRRQGDQPAPQRREAAGFLRQPVQGRGTRCHVAGAGHRHLRVAQFLGSRRAAARRTSLRPTSELRHRRHQFLGTWARCRRPRPCDPDRRPRNGLFVPPANGPHGSPCEHYSELPSSRNE